MSSDDVNSEGRECSKHSFLFSNTDRWHLYSPEYRNRIAWNVFYLEWRWIWALFFPIILVLSGAYDFWYLMDIYRHRWFIYLTNWGFLAFTVAQLINAVVSTMGYVDDDQSEDIKWYMKLNWFCYKFTSAEAVLIPMLFWTYGCTSIASSSCSIIDPYMMISQGVNGLHVLLDIWITGMPIRALHFYLPLTFGLLYIIFTIIYDYAGGTTITGTTNYTAVGPYTYSELDWNGNVSTLTIYRTLSIAVGIVVIHFLLFGCYKLRVFIYKKCGYNTIHPDIYSSNA